MTRVKRIQIRNILGVEELTFEPGSGYTLITGRNGEGKTSVLEAIRAAVKGGHDATLLRKGAEEGEVVLLLDDELTIRKRVTPTKSTLTVRHPDFGNVSAGQTFLDSVTDALTVNPVEFLMAGRNRLEYLLEALPLQLPADEIKAAVDGVIDQDLQLDTDAHPLEVVDGLHKSLYDERTGVNRIAKESRAHAEELAQSLPADSDESDPAEQIAAIDERMNEIAAEALRASDVSLTELDRRNRAVNEAKVAALQQIERAHAETVRAADQERDESIRELESETRAKLESYDREHRDLVERSRPNAIPEFVKLGEERAALEERSKVVRETANTRRMLERAQEQAAENLEQSKRLTEALARLDAIRLGLLSQIPIEGVEVSDGELLVDGVPFDRVNHARQVEIAVRIAEIRAGKLPLVCVDGLELLDTETFAAFAATFERSNLQPIVTRVSDGDLEIETRERAGVH